VNGEKEDQPIQEIMGRPSIPGYSGFVEKMTLPVACNYWKAFVDYADARNAQFRAAGLPEPYEVKPELQRKGLQDAGDLCRAVSAGIINGRLFLDRFGV